ncbi:MAG: type III toxin-antitoxin system TenpIN family toxin [Lachnospiraceae bacterium]
MQLPDNDYQILKLTDIFYRAYPNPPYIEIMKKDGRAYNCLLFQTHYDYFICIPYRTEIIHNYAYHFKKSVRSKKHKSGLDYTKIVIINNLDYIDSKDAFVDKDEFNETMIHLEKIKREALEFVEDYVQHIEETKILHPAEFKRRYRFSSLKYFHKELGINESDLSNK